MRYILLIVGLICFACKCATASESALHLDTPTGRIEGTLLLPDIGSRWPAVLIISGSGPTDRDGNTLQDLGTNDSLKLLAVALCARGIASVRYDKRGVGMSTAAGKEERDLRFDDYVEDAQGWLRLLLADDRFVGVGIVGHSEGASIGLAVSRILSPSMFVSIAGPGRRASEVIRRQLAGRLPAALAAKSEIILQSLEHGETVTDVPAELQVFYRPSVQPYLISWFRFDPAYEAAQLSIPCLLIQGDTDIQISIEDVEALGSAQRNCIVNVVHGMNHILKVVRNDRAQQITSYGNRSLPVAKRLVTEIADFILSRHP